MRKAMKVSEVRIILLRAWDPLGIGDNPHLTDEYDAYIPDIIRLVQQGSDAAEIVQHLKKIETSLGIHPPSEGRTRAAKQLIETAR